MITFNLGIQIGGSYTKGVWKLTTTSLMQVKEHYCNYIAISRGISH